MGIAAMPNPNIDHFRKAAESAFDSHYTTGEWINDLDVNTAQDLILRLWNIANQFRDDTGHKITEDERSVLMKAELRDDAEHFCQRFSDNNFEDFL